MTAVTEPKVKKPKAKAASSFEEPSFDPELTVFGVAEDDEQIPPLVDDLDPVEVAQAPLNPPKPGEPGFDWDSEYPDEDVFVYTATTGVTVGLAAMSDQRRPKPGTLRKLRFQPQVEQMWFVLETVSSAAALEVSDEFDDKDYSQMWEQWSEWSNTSAGES